MLSGHYELEMNYPPYPKITWDRVNGVLYPEKSARLIAFRSSGTIPDVQDYDVYFEKRSTRVGRLDEGFVERLHVGDIFILGSSSWRVLRFQRNRVIVEDVYGRAPTIPFWGGDRDSRTCDLGVLVGRFRREMQAHLVDADVLDWLQREYYVDGDGARAITEYFWEQQSVTGKLASDRLLLIERFRDELGLQQIIIHSSFGIRVNDAWAMALSRAIAETLGFRPQTATVDDGILITVPKGAEADLDAVLDLVTAENVDGLLERAVLDSPVFASRFRHNAVRSLMVLREYRGKRTPVWLQSLRASDLLEACRSDRSFPLMVETLRECMNESLDVPNLRQVLGRMSVGKIHVETIETRIPSPFAHSLLLVGQFGDFGTIPTRERRSRLMHLHRELLKQILDEETLRNLLDRDVVEEVDARLQRTHPQRKARDANELARVLLDLGDLVHEPDDEISLLDRIQGPLEPLLGALAATRRAVRVSVPTAETHTERWIATENLPLYRAAFAVPADLDDVDRQLLETLSRDSPLPPGEIPLSGRQKGRLERLARSYLVLRVPHGERMAYVATETWVPEHIRQQKMSRQEARLALVHKLLRWRGPVTKYEIMERYGFSGQWVERALETLTEQGHTVCGEYVPTKSLPQWCYRPNLERIHSLTLQRLRKEMEPAAPAEYADFLLRWQHLHPDTRLCGLDGLREVIRQLQGQENYQIVYERDLFPGRVEGYEPSLLDRLCYTGEVIWRRFDLRRLKRGQIGFCLRADQEWVVPDPSTSDVTFRHLQDDDIPEVHSAVRAYLRENGACFFDDIVEGTNLDWRLVLRSVWHLVWTGEATNDSYESIRYADVASGLSACYDLATKPGRKGVTIDTIVRHMLENRRLDPRLGRWAPTERLVPAVPDTRDEGRAMERWAAQLLDRYGVVSREMLKHEVSALPWKGVRRALVKLELMGKVRRGYLIEGLSGEQYATPEAVEALHEAKLRQVHTSDNNGPVDADDLVLLNLADPANPYRAFFPITDVGGKEIKVMRMPTKYLVLQAGRPVILYEGRIVVLRDLSRDVAEAAIRLLTDLIDHRSRPDSRTEISIREWNYHPIDVSPARHLLLKLGFVQVSNRWRGFVYDGTFVADPETAATAEAEIPDVFEHAGKEEAPVVYDAEWVISRSEEAIRPKVRELIGWLEGKLGQCEFIYRPRYIGDFQILYRGMRCIHPHIQRRQIWVRITHVGWTRGMLVQPDTDLNDPSFVSEFAGRFEKVCDAIDALLERKRPMQIQSESDV